MYPTKCDSCHNKDDMTKQFLPIVSTASIWHLHPKYCKLWQDDKLSSKGLSTHDAPHAANHVANVALIPIEGISNSGTTGHFVLPSASVKNHQVSANPIITKTLPDEKKHSTHKCNLDLPWLLHALIRAHVILGLAHSSLIYKSNFVMGDAKWLLTSGIH